MNGQTVLDFGCGTGRNTVPLAKRGATVIGIDISEDLIRLARQRAELHELTNVVRFVVASAHDLPLASGSVDVVFGIAILHHLDLGLVAKETQRVLREGGRGIFQEPVRNSSLMRVLRSMVPYQHADVSPYERPLTDGELEAFAAPFRSYRRRSFSLPHVSLANVVPLLRPAIHTSYRVDASLLRWFPGLSHLAGVRVLEVRK